MAYAVVLKEGTIEAKPNVPSDTLTFTIPANAVAAEPILMFMVHGTWPANDLKASVLIDNAVVWVYGPTDENITRPFHSVLDALQPGNHTLKAKVDSGQGTFRMAEIVIWYKVILTPTANPITLNPTANPTTITPTVNPVTITPTVNPVTVTPTINSITVTPTIKPIGPL